MSLQGEMTTAEVVEVEQVAMAAWPGLEVEADDGWLLRFASGITRRANSVWPNRAGDDGALDERHARVERFYHGRGLPGRYQVCPAAMPGHLDGWLAQRGYAAVARTAVQTTALSTVLSTVLSGLGDSSAGEVEIAESPTAAWWDCYATADDVAADSIAGRQRICAAIQQATAYATVFRNGKAIGVGSAAVSADWVGFFNIATLPEARRMGAARSVMAALARWGHTCGASRAYLQVMASNEAALRLYARMGFVTGYYYHYREER